MLPVVTEFVREYKLEDFIVVADSGLMNSDNIADLEANGYKYIIVAKIKNESKIIKEWILSQPKNDCQMVEYDKRDGKRLLVGYTYDRARKDAYNREKDVRRLEKAYPLHAKCPTHQKSIETASFEILASMLLILVGMTRLELATSRPPDACATNCATSRPYFASAKVYVFFIPTKFFFRFLQSFFFY